MNAIDIIKEAAETWPVTFQTRLKGLIDQDHSYGATHPKGPVRGAIFRRADAIECAARDIELGNFENLKPNMAGAIPALAAACEMLGYTREQRMEATTATWPAA